MTAPGGVHVSELSAGDHVTAGGHIGAVVTQITREPDGSTALALAPAGGGDLAVVTLPAAALVDRQDTPAYLANAELAGTGSLR